MDRKEINIKKKEVITMAENWYIFKNGLQTGPFSLSILEQMVRTRELAETDLVISDQMKEWVSADKVSGLFSATIYAPPPPVSTPINIATPPPPSASPPVISTIAVPPSQFAPPPPTAAGSKSFSTPPSPAGGPGGSAYSFQPNIGSRPAPNSGNQRMAVKPGWQKWKTPIIIGSVVILLLLAVIVIAALADEPTPVPDTAQAETQPSGETVPAGIGSQGEQSQATTQQGVNVFNEPGYGFTMNYLRGWNYTIAGDGSVIFQGAQDSDDFYNIFMVMVIPTSRNGGNYSSLNDVLSGLREQYDSMDGEILNVEEVEAQIGNLTHRVLQVIANYDSIEGNIIEVSFIIERDSNYFYQLLYSAPEEISEAYIDIIMSDVINTFIFTDF
jgi:hypothetical protein